MPWSIFTQGGGTAAAADWADELLQADQAPINPTTERFVYDWETSEGGGGAYNPLNQGPVPGQPALTTTGSQYGGGAADFASPAAGIAGAVDYLNMPAYAGVQQALKAGTSYQAMTTALWNSPWASSHYGYGANWQSPPFPGSDTNAASYPGTAGGNTAAPSPSGTSATTTGIISSLSPSTWEKVGVEVVGVLVGAGLVAAGLWKAANPDRSFAATIGKAAMP